jgi:hypothetical protein
MSALTQAEDLAVATTASRTSLSVLGQAFEAWRDPPAYEPSYEELVGLQAEPEGLDESLELRTLSL